MSQQNSIAPKTAAYFAARKNADIISKQIADLEMKARVRCLTPEEFRLRSGNLRARRQFEVQSEPIYKRPRYSQFEKMETKMHLLKEEVEHLIVKLDQGKYNSAPSSSPPAHGFTYKSSCEPAHFDDPNIYLDRKTCPLCGRKHAIDNCDRIRDPEERRRRFIEEKWCPTCGRHKESTWCPVEVFLDCRKCHGNHYDNVCNVTYNNY